VFNSGVTKCQLNQNIVLIKKEDNSLIIRMYCICMMLCYTGCAAELWEATEWRRPGYTRIQVW